MESSNLQASSESLVSVVMVNYNGKDDLLEAIPSLLAQSYPNAELIVVDNASTDDSLACVRRLYPEVVIVEAGRNAGFGAGNNLGIARAKGELIVFTNYDATFDVEWLRWLVEAANSSPDVGLVAPCIVLADVPDQINTAGLAIQYTGHVFARGLYSDVRDYSSTQDIGCVSGACFLVKRSVVDIVGVFDEYYHRLDRRFFHSSLEDVDVAWRTLLGGYRIVYEPRAKMYHKYIPKPLTPLRFAYLERGRHYTILKNYKYTTLILLAPGLVFAEILSIGFVALRGWSFLKEKMRGYLWLLRALPAIVREHGAAQRLRVVGDARVISLFQSNTELRHSPLPKWLSRVVEGGVNAVFALHYGVVYGLARLLRR